MILIHAEEVTGFLTAPGGDIALGESPSRLSAVADVFTAEPRGCGT